jgi:integral membrane protein
MLNFIYTLIGRLRVIAFIEGVSFLGLLFITMPLKYIWDMPQPNKVLGLIHGVLFVYYIILVIQARFEFNWSIKKTSLALLASIIPFGTFWADYKLFNIKD